MQKAPQSQLTQSSPSQDYLAMRLESQSMGSNETYMTLDSRQRQIKGQYSGQFSHHAS